MYASPISAHGDLDLRIKAMTGAIELHPDSAELYFKRGKLRFQHEEFEAAVKDFNFSISKGFINELQQIYLAKSWYKLHDYDQAQKHLQTFLQDDPKNVVGINLKGRILFAQEAYVSSAKCFEEVIQLSIRSLPENYLEAVHSWNASSHPAKYQKAVEVLELGLEKLGPIVTLQNSLINIHLDNGNKDKALAIQLEIIDKRRRKESAYFKLAEIYFELDEKENAKQAIQKAKSELDKLPRRIRGNTAMQSLNQQIEQFITKLI